VTGSQTDTIRFTKKKATYLLILSVNVVPTRFCTTHKKLNALEHASSHIALCSVITVCWIYETASNHIPFIAVFNLGNEKSVGAKPGE
jgi:hypothetical protein